jgi:hypothetical protein
MAANQFFTDAFRNIAQIEPLVFLGDLGMEHHLQQKISQFFFEMGVVAMADGIGNFVGLLEDVGHQGRMGLFKVPRASPIGVAQA